MRARDLILAPDLSPEEARRFLLSHGFSEPERADRSLQRLADTVRVRERLAEILDSLLESCLQAADPDAALVSVEAFFEAVPHPLNLVAFLQDRPYAAGVLAQVMGASPYLAQVLVRNPEYFYWLVESKRLERVEDRDYFERQAAEATQPFASLERSLDALRRLRRRESLRVGAQDILRTVDLKGTVSQVSRLADALLQRAFELMAGDALPSGRGFAVMALGKLGGEELNFSSDVDLLYVYEDAADRERMLRFARDYTRAVSEYTAQGRLYRVDLRLRPMGQTGEIAYPLEAYRQYWETWADTFDRLALLKCRPAAGDPELGRRFAELAEEFIYKKYLDLAAVEEIRWLKRRTDRDLRRRDDRVNVKLGLGGIREIEFFVQSFQLLYGGGRPEIRTPRTLEALDRLVDGGFIPPEEHGKLRSAYIFLRDLEHKLQLVHDRQTHTLPGDAGELHKLARRMGLGHNRDAQEAGGTLDRLLEEHSAEVHRIFESLFESDEKSREIEELILSPEMSREEAVKRLEAHGIPEAEAVLEGIHTLREARAFPHSPARVQNLLANLLPLLLEASRWCEQPRRLFSRLDRFAEALGSRAALYSSLVENPQFAEKLFTVLASSESLAEVLIRNPELLDSLTRPPAEPPGTEELERLAERERAMGRDPRNPVRLFRQREEFKLAVRDLFEPEAGGTRQRLSRLAEICLEYAWSRALETTSFPAEKRVGLLCLGKLGGRELTYHSDLDVIFVYDDTADRISAREAADFLKELRDELELYTEAGRAYRLDLRLRPEGRHGPLAVPRSALERYFASGRARAWERLAFVKARPLGARDAGLDLRSLVWSQPFTAEEKAELHHIRLRKEKELGREDRLKHFDFKVGRGGLMDVQFAVQYLQIQHRVPEPRTREALERLKEKGFLDPGQAERLREGLEFLFRLEALSRLLSETPVTKLPRDPAEARLIARFLGFQSGETLLRRYREIATSVREVYLELFEL